MRKVTGASLAGVFGWKAFLWALLVVSVVASPREALHAQLASAVGSSSDPQAVGIVESYLKAIGGREVLGKIKDRVTSFRNVKYQSTGETVAEISLYLKDNYMIREEWDIKGFDIKGKPLAFVQIYNGNTEEAWVQMLGTVSPLEGKTLNVFVWDKHMSDFFVDWEGRGYTLKLEAQGLVDDQPCDIIKALDFSGRQQLRYFFSRTDGLLLKKEWRDDSGDPGNPVKREQYYKQYRDLPFLDGSGLSVKFPLLLEIFADGDLDTERRYTNVRFNAGLSDKLFDRPEGISFKQFVKEKEAKEAEEGKAEAAAGAAAAGGKKPQGSAKKKAGSTSKKTAPPAKPAPPPADGAKAP